MVALLLQQYSQVTVGSLEVGSRGRIRVSLASHRDRFCGAIVEELQLVDRWYGVCWGTERCFSVLKCLVRLGETEACGEWRRGGKEHFSLQLICQNLD